MKTKSLSVILATILLLFSVGCADSKYINGKIYQPCGVFDQDKKNSKIHYSVSAGNVVWSILLVESVIAPIIIVGWYLWEPDCTIEEFNQAKDLY